jgi:hypothetical protein
LALVHRAENARGTGLASLMMGKGFLSRIETGNVMRIDEIGTAKKGGSAVTDESLAAQAAEPSRALVPLAPPAPTASAAPLFHRQAPFLAHLLAAKAQHAQTRERRRAAPRDAIAAYRATAQLTS